MLPLIPAAMGVTLLIAYILSMTGTPDTALARSLADNMLLQHKIAVERVLRQDLTAGTLSGLLSAPFTDMGDWDSRLVTAGGVTLVATVAGPDSTAPAAQLARGLADLEDAKFVNMPRSASGRYQSVSGANKVGETGLDGLSLPFVNGTPVVVTIIRENGAG